MRQQEASAMPVPLSPRLRSPPAPLNVLPNEKQTDDNHHQHTYQPIAATYQPIVANYKTQPDTTPNQYLLVDASTTQQQSNTIARQC